MLPQVCTVLLHGCERPARSWCCAEEYEQQISLLIVGINLLMVIQMLPQSVAKLCVDLKVQVICMEEYQANP